MISGTAVEPVRAVIAKYTLSTVPTLETIIAIALGQDIVSSPAAPHFLDDARRIERRPGGGFHVNVEDIGIAAGPMFQLLSFGAQNLNDPPNTLARLANIHRH